MHFLAIVSAALCFTGSAFAAPVATANDDSIAARQLVPLNPQYSRGRITLCGIGAWRGCKRDAAAPKPEAAALKPKAAAPEATANDESIAARQSVPVRWPRFRLAVCGIGAWSGCKRDAAAVRGSGPGLGRPFKLLPKVRPGPGALSASKSKPEAAAPKPEAAAPKPEAAAPKPEAAAPKPEAAAPKPEAAASKPAPKPEAAVTKPEGPAVKRAVEFRT